LSLLEERCLLSATFTVTSTDDSAPANFPTPGTLRWAVEQANAAPGGAAINFNLTTPAAITLAQGNLELLNLTGGTVIIDGPGAGNLTISGGGHSNVFVVDLNQSPTGALTTIISGVTIAGGSVSGSGGGVFNRGTMALTDCTLSGNTATVNGGALDNYGQATLINCIIANNYAGTATSAGRGGAIDNESLGTVTLTGCTLSSNTAGRLGFGGALFDAGTANLADCTVSKNIAVNSGSGSRGGGLEIEGAGTANLTDCTLSGNTAGALGGGLCDFFGNAPTLTRCTIESNSALQYGGGLAFLSPANLIDCTISTNSAGSTGGGLVLGLDKVSLTNCTISGNSATGVGGGFDSYAMLQLTSCTISGNSGSSGAGLYDESTSYGTGKSTLTDTIVAGNTAPGGVASDIGGAGASSVTGSNNLIGTGGSGGITGGSGGNIVTADPKLGALVNNGGLTQTIALLPGSPAIGAGTAVGAPSADQRGLPRPAGAIDIGAFQTQAVPDLPPIAAYQLAGTGAGVALNGQVSAMDPDNNPLTYSEVTSPAHGSLTLNSDGSFTYTPAAGFSGIDSFTFLAFDGIADSNVATVSILVSPVNLPPVANNDTYSTAPNTTLTVSAPGVLANDKDPDGDPITAVLVSQPADGTLTFNADGSFTYTPAAGFSGTDSFTYQASDGQLLSNVATVTINLGQPPVANDDSYSTNENTPLSVAAPGVLANDVSPSGEPLTCAILATPTHGHVILNPDGSFTYTPAANFTGTDSFTYEDSDGQLHSNVATVTLNVFDHPVAQDDTYGYTPNSTLTTAAAQTFVTMSSQPGDFVGQGQTYNFTPANSTINASIIRDGVIANGVQITITAPGQSWTLSFAAPSPGWLVPGTYTGATRWPFQAPGTPGLDVSGDGRGANMVAGQFTVTQAVYASGNVVSFAASFTQYGDGSTSALTGQVDFNFTNNEQRGVLANDTDPNPGATLTAILVGNPSHGTVTLNPDGSFTYTPAAGFAGTDSFTYEANNGLANSNVATVTLNPDYPPQAQADAYSLPANSTFTAGAGGTFLTMDSQPGDYIGQGQPYFYTPANSSFTATAFANTVQVQVTQFGESWTLDFQAPNSGRLVPGLYPVAVAWPSQTAGSPALSVSGFGRGFSTITGHFTVTQAVYDPSGNIISFAASFVQYADGAGGALTGQVAFDCTSSVPGVLANDTDPNPATTLTAVLVSNPAHGTVVFNPDGSFSYAPVPGFMGTDSFTYLANDGSFSSNVATVTLTVASPVANNDSYTMIANTTLSVAAPGVLANDTDPHHLPLTAVLVAQPAHGTLALGADGSFTYTPAANFLGTDSFTYLASDGQDLSAVATVTIEVTTPSHARLIRTDTTTEGSWIGSYGAQGYDIVGRPANLPPHDTITPSGQSTLAWSPYTTDPRALQFPHGNGRIAEAWYSTNSFRVDVNLADGQAHDLELYFLDWDSNTRSELVQVSDYVTGIVLSSQSVSSFHSGVYLDYLVGGTGHIVMTITRTAGANAVLSGLFLDPATGGAASVAGGRSDTSAGRSAPQTGTVGGPMVLGDFVGAASTVGLAAAPGTFFAGPAGLGPRGAAVVDRTGKPTGRPAVRVAERGPRPDGSLLIAASRRLARRPVGMVRQPRFSDRG
jgi:VCBS repeat-containing protein